MGGAEEQIRRLAEEVAIGMGIELVDVELRGSGRRSFLRIILDKEGGVTVGDCERFSRDMGALLDVEDAVKSPYTLEVSSPGLDRPLRTARDFRRHLGKAATVSLREKVEGRGALSGTIEEALDDRVRLVVDGKEVEIAYENILKAVLEIGFK